MTLDRSCISRIGFGVSGPHKTIAASRKQTNALIHEAFDLGINLFDSAPKYGNGEAERRLGVAVAELDRSRLFLVTKAGILNESNERDFSPDGIERSLDGSLARLRTDYVDALLLQGAACHELTDELFARLEKLKKAGKIRYAGASGRGEELKEVATDLRLDILMAPHYFGRSEAQKTRLQQARTAGKTVLGIEASSGSPARLPSPFSRAGIWYFFRALKRQQEVREMRRRGESVPPRGDKPIAEALQWAIDSPLSDCQMIQTTTSRHLRANARMAGL